MSRARASLGGAAFLALAAASQAPQEDGELRTWLDRLADDGRAVRLASTEGLTCAECHATIVEEWAHSAHATAWQDEHYQKELRKVRRKQKCHGCHIPPPMVPAGLPQHPEPRADRHHLGIDCEACHLAEDGETILGPWGAETAAHPTRASEHMQAGDDSLCIACHATSIGPVIGIAKDFVDTQQAELDLSCVGCHMPALRGPIANDPAGEETYASRKRRSHRLMTPRDPVFLASAFGLATEVRDGKTVLSIENRAGHRIPGLTRRTLTFVARVIDDEGDVVAEREHVIDHRHFLPVEETYELVLDEVGVTLHVEGRHAAEGIRRYQVFVDRSFEL